MYYYHVNNFWRFCKASPLLSVEPSKYQKAITLPSAIIETMIVVSLFHAAVSGDRTAKRSILLFKSLSFISIVHKLIHRNLQSDNCEKLLGTMETTD